MAEPGTTSYHWTPDEFRRHGHEVVEWVARYLEMIEDHPVQRRRPGLGAPAAARRCPPLPAAALAAPEDFAAVLADLDRRASHRGTPRRRPVGPHRGAAGLEDQGFWARRRAG